MPKKKCVVSIFGHITIYKVKNLKVHSKGRYFLNKNPFSRTTTNRRRCRRRTLSARWTTKLFSCIWVFVNPAYGNSNGWPVGRTLGWAPFKIDTQCGCFYITVFSNGNQLFSENLGMSFSFHLAYNVSVCEQISVLCIALLGKPQALPLQHCLQLAEN